MLIQRLFQTVLISGVVALVVPAAAAPTASSELPLCGESKADGHAGKGESKKGDKKNETAEEEKKDDKKKEAKDEGDAPA